MDDTRSLHRAPASCGENRGQGVSVKEAGDPLPLCEQVSRGGGRGRGARAPRASQTGKA